MSERSQAASDVDQRLAEIDRTLRSIQVELVGGRQADGAQGRAEPEREAAPRDEPSPAPPRERPPGPPARDEPPPSEPVSAREPPPHVRREPPLQEAPPSPRQPPRRARTGPLATLLERAAREQRPAPDPLEQITALSGIHVRLLDSSHELLEAYHTLLEQLRDAQNAQAEPEPVEVTLAAGPFMTLDAVRDFERALSAIPGVIDVAVRGYERGDRAIVDIQLRDPGTRRSP